MQYVLEPKFQNTGVNTIEWYPSSCRVIIMRFRTVYSTQVGVANNLVNGTILVNFPIVFDYMLYTVMSITAIDT